MVQSSSSPPLSMVGLAGMPGAGKSTAGLALESLGAPRIVMGDVVRGETARRGLEATPQNIGKVMLELRKERGEAAVAELCLKRIRGQGSRFVIIDGLRSMAEVDLLRQEGALLVVAVHASRRRRYELLKQRGRSDDPPDWDAFVARDERELDVGVAKVVAMADEVVSNEHASPEELGTKVVEVVRAWRDSLG